jgi:hypothetical protein
MQHYLLATSWLICNQFHALPVEHPSISRGAWGSEILVCERR